MRNGWISVLLVASSCALAFGAGPKVPILYSTDLFHPHADPDDHYDLACLFAMPELDVRGVLLDLGAEQAKRCGRPAVEQMMHLAGRKVPCAVGLSRPLRSRTDTATDEPKEFQGAVDRILSVLRESNEKVSLFTTGSCRDVAAAFNREPELLKKKVRAVYFNIGRGPNEAQEECNVGYDPASYLRIFESGLPAYWCPCFGKDGYETLYQADQAAVVGACSRPVQNYFVYCLTKSTADPIAFLQGGPHSLPTGPRSMWCTAPMFHAAGRKVYERAPEDYIALQPGEAERRGLAGKALDVFRFVPMETHVGTGEQATRAALPEPKPGELAAAYWGREQDRVGTGRPEPDGRADCCVRVLGIPADKKIKNVVLTGPRKGRWEFVATGRWWRVAIDRDGRRLDGYFQFYAAGDHEVEVVYEDGAHQSARFQVPQVDPLGLRIVLDPANPNGLVFRSTHPRYKQIMASCLKNLLADLGR